MKIIILLLLLAANIYAALHRKNQVKPFNWFTAGFLVHGIILQITL